MARLESSRIDMLDALRGWAVLGVVMVHSGQFAPNNQIELKITAAGQYGVQLFFIVSALTISLTYDSHVAQFGASLRSQLAWFTKRVFRIAPLYYFASLFYPIEQHGIYVLSNHRYGKEVGIPDIFANMLFLHTWIPSANNSVVPGGWSIGVEMFFYTMVPFCWLIVPLHRRVKLLGICAIAFLIVTELVSKLWTGSFFVGDNSYLYYWFPTQAPVLIIGLVFYFLCGSDLHMFSGRGPVNFWPLGFMLLFLAGVYLGTWKGIAPVLAPTVMAFSFLFLIMSLRSRLKRFVVTKLVSFLGRISFGVYIFHFAVLDLLRAICQILHYDHSGPFVLPFVFAAVVVLTSGIALIGKRIIEDPAIAYGHRLGRFIASGNHEARPSPV